MKKALTLVVLIATPAMILAQGTVAFNNLTGLVQRWTSASDSSLTPVPAGGGYVQLLATAKGNPLVHPLGVYEGSSGFLPAYPTLAGFFAANPGWAVPAGGALARIAAPGWFNGGTATIGGIAPGLDADYVVIGWTGPYATYDAAYAADLADPDSSFVGISTIATTQTGGGYINPGVAVNLYHTFQGITLAPAVVPEPTTFLLAGLGAILLLLLLRRADIPVRSDFRGVPRPRNEPERIGFRSSLRTGMSAHRW